MYITLSREMIHLMLQSQRIIKKEFGVKIELDDDQVMARVFAYAAQSSSDALKSCAKSLMQQLLPQAETEAGDEIIPKAPAIRVYRGQLIEQDVTTPVGDETAVKKAPGRGKTIVYRGQKITG